MRRSYSWRCLACDATNAAGLSRCSTCGCPSHATLQDIKAHQPKPSASELEALALQETRLQHNYQEALRLSHFRKFYWLSVGCYAVSLMSPDGSGLYMLLMGYAAVAAGFSAAWLANPLILSAFLLTRSNPNPLRWRWLIYGAFALTLSTPVDLLRELPTLTLFFCSLWSLSPLALWVGMHRYRSALRGLANGT